MLNDTFDRFTCPLELLLMIMKLFTESRTVSQTLRKLKRLETHLFVLSAAYVHESDEEYIHESQEASSSKWRNFDVRMRMYYVVGVCVCVCGRCG